MTRKLVIRLEGASPDLGGQADSSGVSLRFFATYAKRLRDAYQRSAQAVVTGTAQDAGRLPKRAAQVDIRLVASSAGSLNLDLVPVDTSPQVSLGEDLADRALERFFADLDAVARDPESTTVPKALRVLVGSVPGEVRQRYSIVHAGGVERSIELTSSGVAIAAEPVLASVEQVNATVRGVICHPCPAVLLDSDDGRIQATTSAEWMDRAWQLRDRTDLVATIVINSSGTRLLAIRPVAEQDSRPRAPSVEETLQRFDGVLRILAR